MYQDEDNESTAYLFKQEEIKYSATDAATYNSNKITVHGKTTRDKRVVIKTTRLNHSGLDVWVSPLCV